MSAKEKSRAVVERDEGAARLAEAGMRHRHHRRFPDRGVAVEDILDLLGAEVFAAADDEVLLAAGDDEAAFRRHPGEVAGAEEAVGVEGAVVVGPVRVADEVLRAAGGDLAFLAVGDEVAMVVDEAQLVADHVALGRRGELLAARIGHAEGDGRRLGAAVDAERAAVGEGARSPRGRFPAAPARRRSGSGGGWGSAGRFRARSGDSS